MHLLNRVSQFSNIRHPVVVCEADRPLDRVASQLALTEARYVLMDDLADMCQDLAFDQPDLLGDCFDLIRLPNRVTWIEWRQRDEPDLPSYKVGLLVRCSEDGRSGTIQVIWENDDQCPRPEKVRLFFDFNDDLPHYPGHALKHAEHDLSGVLRHFWLDPACRDREVLVDAARHIWLTGPVVASFCLLLLFRDGIELRGNDPSSLNARRSKQRKAPLLSHIEVHGRLFHARSPQVRPYSQSDHGRHVRLHHVRGHFVRRANKIFWRKPHLRGDGLLGSVEPRTRVLSI